MILSHTSNKNSGAPKRIASKAYLRASYNKKLELGRKVPRVERGKIVVKRCLPNRTRPIPVL